MSKQQVEEANCKQMVDLSTTYCNQNDMEATATYATKAETLAKDWDKGGYYYNNGYKLVNILADLGLLDLAIDVLTKADN